MRKILVFFSFALLALLVIHPVHNVDIWMHIKSGEWIVKNLEVQRIDDYSYTAQGAEWLNHQWLSQVFYFLFYRFFGVNGLIYLKAILIFAAFFLLFKNIYRKDAWLRSIFIFILVILLSQERFLARPLVFSLFLFSLFVFILHGYKYIWPPEKQGLLYLLIPLQAFWINLHGAAIMGIFLVWAYIIGEFIDSRITRRDLKSDFIIKNAKYKRLFYVGILMLIVTGLTPYGYNTILFPIKEAGDMYFITEWLPSIYKDTFLNFGVMPYYRLFLFISMLVFIFRARILSSSHIIIFAGLLYLSLSARRHLPFYGFAIAPCIIEYAKSIEFKNAPLYFRKSLTYIAFIILLGFLIFQEKAMFTGAYFMKMPNGPRVGLGKIEFPDDAADFIIKTDLKGNMFNDYGSGCFLIWRLYPERRVFLDGRNTIYGPQFIKEKYIDCMRNPALFERLVNTYGIEYVFLYYAFSNTENIIPYLYHSRLWELLFFDDRACIFVRNNKENAGIIGRYRVDLKKKKNVERTGEYSWQQIYPHDYINRAAFYEKVGFLDMAIETLRDTIAIEPGVGDLYYNLGTLYVKKEMWPDAIGVLGKAARINRLDIDAYNNLGLAYARSGRYRDAIGEFRKVLWLNPLHREASHNIKKAKRDYVRQKQITE